ncbi:MAG: hypothetical protein AAGB93_12550 [Planctomycetota bacterium]
MVRSASLLLCFLAATAGDSLAQSKAIRLSPSTSTVVIGGSRTIPPEILAQIEGGVSIGGMSVSTPKSEDGEEADEKPVDPQRLQMFQQAMLDRRPSNILAEWAKPDPLPSDEDPELQDPEDPEEPGDEPTKPEEPKEPTRPEDLVEPLAPEDVTGASESLADVVALAKAREEAREGYAEAKAAYDEKLAAYEAEVAAFETAKAEYEEAKKKYDEEKPAWDERKKAYDKEKAKVDKKKAELKQKRLKRDVDLFRRNVALGRWADVEKDVDGMGKAQAKNFYAMMLGKISRPPQPMSGQLAPYQEQCAYEFDDIVEIIRIAPEGFDPKKASLISPLVRRVFAQGHSIDDWVTRLEAEAAKPEEERCIDRRLAALLLTALGNNQQMGAFLPTLEEAVEGNDRQGMNLLARHLLAEYREEQRPETLGAVWEATMAVLAPGEVEDDQKKEALKRAVEYADDVRDAKGESWLRETFTDRPDRGMEVLATIGAEASLGMVKRSSQPADRLADLQLMRSAVDALLQIAPDRAGEWQGTLTLLADTWLREAAHSYKNSTQTSMGPMAERDPFGNIYWVDYGYRYNRYRNPVQPVEPDDLLDSRPDGPWRAALPDSLRPKIDQTIAELYLKVNEEKLAFPYIRDLAGPNPKKANELAKTFLDVWIANNDPNSSRNRTSIYNFSYGFNRRASGIPLTRSKQERNLRDLAEWVAKLRTIEGIELDSALLVRAFTQSHSQAEVYRVEVMEEVFGDLDTLEPKTIAAMTQTMRSNLATIWRTPDVQRNAGTNRKQKDIENEVQRGYQIAEQMLERALEVHVDAWELQVARAALMHDLNNYRNELQKSSDFSGGRKEALELFAEAARNYVDAIEDLKTNEYTTEAFDYWFNAALGASDLQAVDQETILAQKEIPLISDLLEDIEGDAGERHRSMFANNLFTRLSSVNPACKNRYLKAGFEIAGEHPQARAARRVYDYYNDLVTEIELVTSVDGDADVGEEPFGIHIDIRYTKEIARESGGFNKYLQNQANAVSYYYNYGRPQENYRDKFEESVRTVLGEQFDVMSVTFNKEDATAKADEEYGWRRTPYAYVLLKARGPEIDRIPPLKIDLDFNDVTGYVVLPISSPVVPIDASADGGVRPYENLQITQVLDERRADEGKLLVEVKAQADGIVPELEEFVDIDPADFEVTKIEDQDVSVARFSDDEDGVLSERLWVVELEAKKGVENPDTFRFAEPKSEDIQSLYQRYDDADLMTASLVVDLDRSYGGKEGLGWWVLPILLGLGVVAFLLIRTIGDPAQVETVEGFRIPDEITPFSVLGLLGEVRRANHMDLGVQRELDEAVLRIERHYFGEDPEGDLDLTSIARRWVTRT